ncbi:hypothetical protein RCO48_08140 [Peribacillus frigoritolerans]|nr:hypothetical protein [Peribacillus frigoritolerans]
MNVDEILTMHKDDAIVIITGKHPTRVKKSLSICPVSKCNELITCKPIKLSE